MSRLFISAAHKSSGKTTVSIGLCAALRAAGETVQAFKKGPDYIDPHWLGKATGRDCFNLDFYTMSHEEILATFSRYAQDASISLIEGNKGLYDGLDLDGSNSNAALAKLLKTPVILVLDARGMTRGIAPLILGYQAFDRDINIRGVILNQLGGSRHEAKLRSVIEHYTDVCVVGAIHKDPRFDIDERHLGLVPSHEDPASAEKIALLCAAVSEQVDLDLVKNIASAAPALASAPSVASVTVKVKTDLRIGIARNAAFGFYYPDDMLALQNAGAELIDIDPIRDAKLPALDGLILGGGFPETHMDALSSNTVMRKSIYDAIENGLPVYAECGGLMYLSRSIEWHGKVAAMVGSIPGDILMEARPQGRGYVQLSENPGSPWPEPLKTRISAHEFHYSRFKNLDKDARFAFSVRRGAGIDGKNDGYIYKNLLACYSHQRSTEKNPWTQRFVQFVRQHKLQTTKEL
jgi:cobyrinic acid a,c-diamide synthase